MRLRSQTNLDIGQRALRASGELPSYGARDTGGSHLRSSGVQPVIVVDLSEQLLDPAGTALACQEVAGRPAAKLQAQPIEQFGCFLRLEPSIGKAPAHAGRSTPA